MFWIVDDTFKTVRTIFTQLYTIHAQVGFGDNSIVLPLGYVLMTSKREQCYNQMYQDIINFAEDNSINLTPEYTINDFEMAVINARKHEFSLPKNKGCLFHLVRNENYKALVHPLSPKRKFLIHSRRLKKLCLTMQIILYSDLKTIMH